MPGVTARNELELVTNVTVVPNYVIQAFPLASRNENPRRGMSRSIIPIPWFMDYLSNIIQGTKMDPPLAKL